MNFEGTPNIPPEFIENIDKKIESGKEKLDLPITEEELWERCAGDQNCEKALNDFLEYSTRYAADVWDMKMMMAEALQHGETEEWQEKYSKADRQRSQLHNALIDSIGILSRALLKADEDTEWVKKLMPTGKLSRAYCGKFAIMLTYSRYVNSASADK